MQRVFVAVDDDPFWAAVYRFALTTAVRPGELVALRWIDIDLDQARATIRRTLTRAEDRSYILADQTKTRGTRTVAMPQSHRQSQ